MESRAFLVAFAVVLVCSSVFAGAAAAQSTGDEGPRTPTGTVDADPTDVTSSPVPGFGAVTAVVAVAAAALVARAASRR